MFSRLMRVIKSWFGFFISFAEDPEVMLQESIEEMRNTLPRLNQVLVTTRATVIRLEQELVDLERQEKSLIGSIQVALKDGSPEARKLAESDAMQLQSLRQELTATAPGTVAAVAVRPGERVAAGQVLVRLYGAQELAELRRIEQEFDLRLLERLRAYGVPDDLRRPDAITQRLCPLGEDVTFVPGHGPTSTFGQERKANPFLQR